MRNALVRLGVPADAAAAILEGCGLDPRARPEELSLETFARVAAALPPGARRRPSGTRRRQP